MMRRSTVARYYWSRYRMPSQMPKFDGPAPVAAPQNMNSTKTNEFIDPIDDKFPISIRGSLVRPDVPEDQYVDSWYVCTSMTHHLGDYRPWTSSAPQDAYRFRPHNEFDAKGREYVQHMRTFSRYNAAHTPRGSGNQHFPFREAFLTKMAVPNNATPPPTLHTLLDRAVAEKHHHQRILSPLAEQRDVGRLEAPLPCAGNIEVSNSHFPFRWKTEDWYEYEISKARNARFIFNNTNATDVKGSEATYRLVLEGFWDHHVAKLAEDVCMFVKEVGKSVTQEKLRSVRQQLTALDGGGAVDPELVALMNAAHKGPFGSADRYTDEEAANFLRADLLRLEEQCVGLINRCNVPIPSATNLYDAQVSWPYVERLQPWVRLAEYWTSSSDTSFTDLEMSSAHYEFRKYFRVVMIKMPFRSTEFEQRLYAIRHWLHRQTSCELHTTARHNLVHDGEAFPTEHDASVPTTHEHHRLFSFALDWQSGPVGYLQTEVVRGDADESWSSIATRLGCSEESLRAANDGVEELVAGTSLIIPHGARRRRTAISPNTQVLPLQPATTNDAQNGATPQRIRTWEEAAELLQCSVEELQQANGAAALSYVAPTADGKGDDGGFDASITELVVPHTAQMNATDVQFATTEPVYAGDSLERISERLQCSVAELQQANPNLGELSAVGAVNVPATSRAPRRLVNPQLRPQAATDALFARTMGERTAHGLTELPHLPDNAASYPHEYHTATSRFPVTPQLASSSTNNNNNSNNSNAAQDSWLSYTAHFLDRELSASEEPTPHYNVNHLWPVQQIPGKVDQTPFVEDQTWLLHPIPVQQMEQHHPEKDLQDLPFVNHEQFPRSLEWSAP